MGRVANAWAGLIDAGNDVDLPIDEKFEMASSADDVEAILVVAGVVPHPDLVEYFETLFRIKPDSAGSILPGILALDLDAAVAEHRELRNFALEAADDIDPDLIYGQTMFPLVAGKPTVLFDTRTAVVVEQWWDEDTTRPSADDLAQWLDRHGRVFTEGGTPLDRFRQRFEGRAAIRLGVYTFGPAVFWLEDASVHIEALRCSRITVRHRAAGSTAHSMGLERRQAELVAEMLVGVGVDHDIIEFKIDGAGDRRDPAEHMNSVWLDGLP